MAQPQHHGGVMGGQGAPHAGGGPGGAVGGQAMQVGPFLIRHQVGGALGAPGGGMGAPGGGMGAPGGQHTHSHSHGGQMQAASVS